MKKSVILCMVAVVLISAFVGCSVKNSDVNEKAETSSFSASKETMLSVPTAENDTKADTTNTATVNTKENANVNSSEKTSSAFLLLKSKNTLVRGSPLIPHKYKQKGQTL